MQVIVNGLMTEYTASGSGKTILLLHGWGDASSSWQGLAKILQQNHQVVAMDLPGFGKTQAPEAVWGLDDYAAYVRDFLKKIDTDTSVIIGHSNGGAIAIRGLSSGMLRADKLVLLASAGIRGTYNGRIKAIRLITKAGKALTTPLPASVKKRLRRKVYQTVGSDMLVAENLQETFKRIVTDDVRADAAKLSLPTLLVYGSEDTAAPVSYGEIFRGLIKGSSLVKIAGAGHFLHQEQLPEVSKLIQEFTR